MKKILTFLVVLTLMTSCLLPALGETAIDEAALLGEWQLSEVIVKDETRLPAELGMSMSVTFQANGEAVLTVDEARHGTWTMQDAAIVVKTASERADFILDGDRLQTSVGRMTLVLTRDGAAEVQPTEEPATVAEPEPTATPVPENTEVPEPENTDAPAAGEASFTETKYTCVSWISGGTVLPASMLGAEYSITFHDNGLADLVLANVTVKDQKWTREGNVLTVDYYGNALGFTLTQTGMTWDFMGSMLLNLEAAE